MFLQGFASELNVQNLQFKSDLDQFGHIWKVAPHQVKYFSRALFFKGKLQELKMEIFFFIGGSSVLLHASIKGVWSWDET